MSYKCKVLIFTCEIYKKYQKYKIITSRIWPIFYFLCFINVKEVKSKSCTKTILIINISIAMMCEFPND